MSNPKHFMDSAENYYICENILNYDGQLGILRMKEPLCFVYFEYDDGYMVSFEEWMEKVVRIEWLEGKAPEDDVAEAVLTDCWNFLALHEREEEVRAERGDYDDEF